jgi:hypothetical protein
LERPRELKKEQKDLSKEKKKSDKRSIGDKLADYGLCIHHDKPDDFGFLRQIKDTSKGLEWPG